MKTKMTATLILLTLGTAALVANAQETGRPPRHGHRPPPLLLVTALDANHDGVISADEIANAPAALKTLDKNGDGQLTSDEYLPPRPVGMAEGNGPAHHPPLSPILKALDTNHDGIISADEIANASAALKTLDTNGDGQLTRDEFCPPPPGHDGGSAPDDSSAPSDDQPPGPPPGE